MNKKTGLFLLISYTFTWAIWFPLLTNTCFGTTFAILPGQFFIGSFGPLIGAVFTTLIMDGKIGLGAWFKRTYSIRTGRKIWIYAAGLPVLYMIVAVIVQKIFLGSWPDWSTFGQTEKLQGFPAWLTLIVWIVTFGLGEESGWRGFLLYEAQKQTSMIKSTLKVGFFWMLWHLPAFFFNPTYTSMGWGIIGWAVSLAFGSVLLGWMAREAKWSILPLMVWHGGFNLLTASDQAGAIMAMAASFLVIFHGVRLIHRFREEDKITLTKSF